MQYTATYSDIIFPQKVNVSITLLNDRMLVTPDGSDKPVEWFYGSIKKKKQTKAFVVLTLKNSLKSELTIADLQILKDIEKLAPYAPVTQPVPWYQSKNGLYSMFAVKIGTIAVAVLIFIFGMPYIIDFIVGRISPETEASIGEKIKYTFIAANQIDTTETRLLNEFFHKLTPPGQRDIHITVVKSSVKNAFSLPGNEIVVYSDILSVMKTYPELVALLGHESGHTVNEHSMKMLCRQSSTTIILLTLVGNMNSAVSIIINNAASIGNLSYSREYETQADKFGYDWMRENKVNPTGMVDLFTHLQNEAGADMHIDFLSTHPSLQTRKKEVGQWMKKDKSDNFPVDSSLEKEWSQIKGAYHPNKN